MAVFGMLSAVAGFVKVRYLVDKAIIDNIVFRAHYRITAAILFVCCLVASAYNLIGDPISCISDGAIPGHVLNTFCWVNFTFSMPANWHKEVGRDVAHPGLGLDSGERTHHAYYQWVPFVLFFQGVLFYLPHWLWKQWEEGKVRMISEGMRGVLVETKTERNARINRLVQYIVDTMHLHNSYASGYFFCEILNFVNVVTNIFLVDKFLGGVFLNYGMDVVSYSNMDQEFRTDPMIVVFPRVTKCNFFKYGPSGTIQKHDALCVLALNILNEKMYIFLWFWFILLAVATGISLLYSMALVLLPSTRETILKRRFKFSSQDHVETLVRKTQIGDFLLIHLLGQNMNIVMFNDLLHELCHQLHLDSSGASPASMPSAPSTLEMSPMYPEIDKFSREAEI